MTTSVSHGAETRTPVHVGKRRIPNLWQRQLVTGETVFEFVGRVDGRVLRRRLVATTKSDAVTEARGLATDRDRGTLHAKPEAPTVAALRDEYLAHLRSLVGSADDRLRRSQRCVDLYERHLDKRFVPTFSTRRVDEITTADLRRWLDTLRATKLAPNTQRGILTAASAMLRYAARQGYVAISPAAGLDRDDRPSSTRKRLPRYLDGKQIEALLAKLGDEYRPLAATLAYAGLRLSECLAVRWRDVDLEAGRLAVTEQLDRSGRPVPLKTTASAATLDILPALARELRAHRARRAALGIHLVRADALVFGTLVGKPHGQRNALRAIVAAAVKAKLGHVTAHDLRHSLVANALDAGLTLAEASRLARHATPAVTATVYADVLEAKRETLGAKLADAGFGG
jgi:integrase